MNQKTKYQVKFPDSTGHIAYETDENETWQILYGRQRPIVEEYACQQFLDGLDLLNLSAERIPQCNEVSSVLHRLTGWQVAPVAALIPFSEFYDLLAAKKFPAASFIRTRDELDYLQEPDIFHEIFGHCPLLTDQAFADFSQAFGLLGQRAPKQHRAKLQRLYWFTVEFGLMKTKAGYRAYGGGILSSKNETLYSVDSPIPNRWVFDPMAILRTPYRYDMMQTTYYVIDDFTDFYQLLELDLLKMVHEADDLGDITPDNLVVPTDETRSC